MCDYSAAMLTFSTVRAKEMLCIFKPLCAKYRRMVVKRENIGIFVLKDTGLPSVPFHVKVFCAVPMLNSVTGICASVPASELAVSVI